MEQTSTVALWIRILVKLVAQKAVGLILCWAIAEATEHQVDLSENGPGVTDKGKLLWLTSQSKEDSSTFQPSFLLFKITGIAVRKTMTKFDT